jgi:rubrerythrin
MDPSSIKDKSFVSSIRNTDSSSRRAFLGTTASLAALGLAGCSDDGNGNGNGTNTTDDPLATETDDPMTTSTDGPTATPTDDPTATETEEPTTTEPMAAPDVPLLNYALTLEHLENAFYRDGLEEFSDDELMNAEVLSGFGERIRMEVPGYLQTVQAHEAAHVDALSATIEDLNGDPLGEGEYDFGYETPSEFLGVAQALENTGVAAYAGAAPQVVNNDVLASAAGIHSVEARHASFLNLVNGDSPYPNAVDEAMSIDEVLDVAGGFITSEVDPSAYELADDRPMLERKVDDDTSDLDVLNYALTLEHLESAFYREGLETFSDDELMNAEVLSEFGEQVRMAVPEHLQTAGAHEAAHVDALSATVQDLGGTPVEEATYDFGYETPSEFFAVAMALENTGVAAYKGAAPTVSNDDVFAAAIGIHSVEARHAAFLNELNGEVPFPDAVDEAMTMDEVTEIAGQFIVEE